MSSGLVVDAVTGLAIKERSGKLRYFVRNNEDELIWGDSKEELLAQFECLLPEDILSVTFIPASLEDNPTVDPGYRAKLQSLPRIERLRLLGGNWKAAEGAQIDGDWIRKYDINENFYEFTFQDRRYKLPIGTGITRRIATIDTAGTSKEKAAEKRGKQPSWTVCGVWDIVPRWGPVFDNQIVHVSELCFLRYVYRKQVDWNQLKVEIDDTLGTWNVQKAYIENAHFGQPLAKEIRSCAVELIGPVLQGMGDHGEGAKLERAIASGMLARFEHGKFFVPRERSSWLDAYLREIQAWTGAPDEVADQIDMTSYAAYVSRAGSSTWGGTINNSNRAR